MAISLGKKRGLAASVGFKGRPLPLRLKNIARREAFRMGRYLTVYSVNCSRGCPHGRAWKGQGHIRLYLSSSVELNTYLLIHELSHIANVNGRQHDAPFYREAIRIAREEGELRGFLNWQGRRAKAEYRRMLAEERVAQAA